MINRSHIIASNFKCLFNEHVTYTVNKKSAVPPKE